MGAQLPRSCCTSAGVPSLPPWPPFLPMLPFCWVHVARLTCAPQVLTTLVLSSLLYMLASAFVHFTRLNPVFYRKGSLGSLSDRYARDPGRQTQSWTRALGSGCLGPPSPTPSSTCPPGTGATAQASSAEMDPPGQPRSPQGTLTPLGRLFC